MDWWKRYSGMNKHRTAVDCQADRLMHKSRNKIGLVSFPTADSESVGSESKGMANSVWDNMAIGSGTCIEPAQ